MIRIDTLERCGTTLTIELSGYINRREFEILRDCLKEYAEEGITEVCIVAKEVRSFNTTLERDLIALKKLGLKLRFQQTSVFLRHALDIWGLGDWLDD